MNIQRFTRGPEKTIEQFAGGELLFNGPGVDDIHMRAQGLPDPDPSTTYIVRLADGQITGVGKGMNAATCDAILEPA